MSQNNKKKDWKIIVIILIIFFLIGLILSTVLRSDFSVLNLQKENTKSQIKERESNTQEIEIVEEPEKYKYIEVMDGCRLVIDTNCVLGYIEASTTTQMVKQFRVGTVLLVDEVLDVDDETWYKIVFDEWLRYPERIYSPLYVKADRVRFFEDEGIKELEKGDEYTGDKRIIVDRSDQLLYAYEGEDLVMEQDISSGILATPTPRGSFTIFRKTPSRYMQGPLPGVSTKYYDLPGVPWNLYFTQQGAVIHGAYWHESFGQPYSNGCVNVPLDKAQELYHWAEVGMEVLVRD